MKTKSKKKCCKCKIHKDLVDFSKDKSAKDGLQSKCKDCNKQYRKENVQKISLYQKENESKYKDRIYKGHSKEEKAKYHKKWYLSHKKEEIERVAIWNKENSEHRKTYMREYVKERSKKDLNFKLSRILRNRLYCALKSNFKSGSAVSDLGCSVDFFKAFIEKQFKPGMTWNNWGSGEGKWQIDHIVPLFSFNLSDIKELQKACNFSNMQPLWYEEHIDKTLMDLSKYKEANYVTDELSR